nr:MAG TPA: hypothetical protein [Caudoviricetes sp.]
MKSWYICLASSLTFSVGAAYLTSDVIPNKGSSSSPKY